MQLEIVTSTPGVFEVVVENIFLFIVLVSNFKNLSYFSFIFFICYKN